MSKNFLKYLQRGEQMSTTIQDISTFTFIELLSFVHNHPVFSSRVNVMHDSGYEPAFMLALAEWDDSKGDISMPAYFYPFFMKYHPTYNFEVGDEFHDIVENHELPLLKAVIESEIYYNGNLPESHTTWRIDFIENPAYTIGYLDGTGVNGWLRKEIANNNVFNIVYE